MSHPSLLILYYTQGGNTERMAKAIAEGAEAVGVQVTMKRVEECGPAIRRGRTGPRRPQKGSERPGLSPCPTLVEELQNTLEDLFQIKSPRSVARIPGHFPFSLPTAGRNRPHLLQSHGLTRSPIEPVLSSKPERPVRTLRRSRLLPWQVCSTARCVSGLWSPAPYPAQPTPPR